MLKDNVILGDCLDKMREIASNSVDFVYLDPPFFTNRSHKSTTRDGNRTFSFNDFWSSQEEYASFISERLYECKRILKKTGSLFFHGDHNNIHIGRHTLDGVFGTENFRSNIVWYYKRWSNSKKGLLQQHQNILFYSSSNEFKWNQMFTDYSATTNVDQIMQKRGRDSRGKSTYATDKNGDVIYTQEKNGVPLGDVWEIPFLNPKAKERTGYPTQKPLLLIERLIQLTTDEGDLVLDPFCGSGTTLVASKLLARQYIGIDISEDAVKLAKSRLETPVRTDSNLLKKGIESYQVADPWVDAHLAGIAFTRIQRNSGIDALLKDKLNGKPCFIRVQRAGETLSSACDALARASSAKGDAELIVIATAEDMFEVSPMGIHILRSAAIQLDTLFRSSVKQSPRLVRAG